MNTATRRSQILVTIGYIAMLIGAIDPMEGSLIILPGSGLVLLGTYLSHKERRFITYRLWVFLMIVFGVAALWGSTVLGGIGGETAYSMWWGLLFLPYPIGWSIGIWGPDSPRWVLWSGIVMGIWYIVMMLLAIKMSDNFGEAAVSVMIFVGFIGIIGVISIAGCIYRLRKRGAE